MIGHGDKHSEGEDESKWQRPYAQRCWMNAIKRWRIGRTEHADRPSRGRLGRRKYLYGRATLANDFLGRGEGRSRTGFHPVSYSSCGFRVGPSGILPDAAAIRDVFPIEHNRVK